MHRWLTGLVAAVLVLAVPGPGRAQRPTAIGCLQAYDLLRKDSGHTFLLDVRSRAEYQFAGHPPMAYNVPWRFFTTEFRVKGRRHQGRRADQTGYQLTSRPNPKFVAVVRSLFKPTDRLVLISANGRRSLAAAQALTKAGFSRVYHVPNGLFGPADDPGLDEDTRRLVAKYSPAMIRRGRVAGWLHWGLPITYEMDPKYVYPPDLQRVP